MRDELLELLEREDVRELEGGDARQQILLALVPEGAERRSEDRWSLFWS